MPCCGPNGSERAMIALAEIVLAFLATAALLVTLIHMLLPARQS